MGLVDDINANTAYVASAKLALERVLRDKGVQVTEDNTSFPTFDQLTTAIEGMQVISDVAGVEDVAVFANENISKGDVCSLIEAKGDFQASSALPPLPTTFVTGNGSISNLDLAESGTGGNSGAYPVAMSIWGDFVFIPAKSYNYYVPFYLKDGEYKQLKVNGSYSTSWSVTDTATGYTSANYAFDKVNKRVFITSNMVLTAYKVDEENLNLIPEGNLTNSGSSNKWGQTVYAHNNNVIVNYYNDLSNYIMSQLYYYDTDTQTFLGGSNFRHGGYSGSGVHDLVVDLTGDVGNGIIYCVVTKNFSDGRCYTHVQKLEYNETSKQYVFGAKSTLLDTSYQLAHADIRYKRWSYGRGSNAQISLSGSMLYLLDTSSTLRSLLIDPVTLSFTEAPLIFNDSFDYTKVDSFALVKGSNYLYVLSTDNNYADNEKLRLYKYSSDTSSWEFVCCPAKAIFSPTLLYNKVPVYSSLYSGRKTLAKSANGNYHLYDVGNATLAFDYYANKSYNTLVSGATDYGIARSDMTVGEIANMTHILSGQSSLVTNAINASIDESIGGAY